MQEKINIQKYKTVQVSRPVKRFPLFVTSILSIMFLSFRGSLELQLQN